MEATDNLLRMLQQVVLGKPLAWFDWGVAAALVGGPGQGLPSSLSRVGGGLSSPRRCLPHLQFGSSSLFCVNFVAQPSHGRQPAQTLVSDLHRTSLPTCFILLTVAS